jgi:hypothetical protein
MNFRRFDHYPPVLILGLWLIASGPLLAQTGVSAWSISVSDATNFTKDGNTYQNTTYAITQFSTSVDAYNLRTQASSVFIRRNTDSSGNGVSNQSGIDNNNYASTWYTQNGSQTNLLGTYQSTVGGMLLNNNVVMGLDNVFQNSTDTTATNTANVERVDFYFGATTVNANEGLTIFERGTEGTHDAVKIAVFTSWNNGAPVIYSGNVVSLTTGSYGSNLDWDPNTSGSQTDMTHSLMRYNNGDNISTVVDNTHLGTQGVAGSFITFADLGIASGTTIYGYSILSADSTTNINNLADWTNATYYPTATPNTSGGIDLISFNGYIAKPVPEPSTYGALLLGSTLAIWWLRRSSNRTAKKS